MLQTGAPRAIHITTETFSHEVCSLSWGVNAKTANKMCSDVCTNDAGCTEFEVEKKKGRKAESLLNNF